MDLNRTMLIVVDVRNSFCTSGGWVDHIGSDVAPDRAPIAPLNRLTPALRRHGVPALWLNWGNRPDLANLPANQGHLYKQICLGTGLGGPLPGSGAAKRQLSRGAGR